MPAATARHPTDAVLADDASLLDLSPRPPRHPIPGTTDDEAALVRRARAGDPAAFAALVERYQGPIYAFTYRMLGNRDDAADLAQDTFVKAYRALGRTNETLNISAWLFRIASNACLDVLRRRQRWRWLPWEGPRHDHLLLSSPADDPERQALSQETQLLVQRVLGRMAPRYRLALLLREVEGLSCQEIGQILGLGGSATKSLLFRAREDFRRCHAALDRTAAATERTTG
jgi:RNA polymerase sigma-70 factor (ECF subfamily)